MIVVGVDGCKGGWVAAIWNVGQQAIDFRVLKSFQSVLDAFPEDEVSCIAIDIPIGLIECRRACDVEARAALKCRKSSVFPAPDPRVACMSDYHVAKRVMEGLCGKSISAQAFGIYPKVCEVNEVMTSQLQDRVIEIHPETSFWAMNGYQEICPPKKSGPGYLERWEALAHSISLPADEWDKVKIGVKGAQSDDVLDAVAAAWTAARWANGQHGSFPNVQERDHAGLRAEIVF